MAWRVIEHHCRGLYGTTGMFFYFYQFPNHPLLHYRPAYIPPAAGAGAEDNDEKESGNDTDGIDDDKV